MGQLYLRKLLIRASDVLQTVMSTKALEQVNISLALLRVPTIANSIIFIRYFMNDDLRTIQYHQQSPSLLTLLPRSPPRAFKQTHSLISDGFMETQKLLAGLDLRGKGGGAGREKMEGEEEGLLGVGSEGVMKGSIVMGVFKRGFGFGVSDAKQKLFVRACFKSFIFLRLGGMRGQSQGSIPPEGQDPPELSPHIDLKAFDWNNRWLKGHEYEHILKNAQGYCQKFGFERYTMKSHPTSIYQRPINGTLYFVEGIGLRSEFGFPRVESKKKFRWKKMNFETNLPKKNPRVTYIVASTTHCHHINDLEEPLFRMHAVVPFDPRIRESCGLILCHILEIKRRTQIDQINTCFSHGRFDFYKLFAFLHNLSATPR